MCTKWLWSLFENDCLIFNPHINRELSGVGID